MDAIIERLNEIINDDKAQESEFKTPTADASPKQRSLLRKQNEDLGFGSVHLNRRVVDQEPLRRTNPERPEIMNLDQNVFFNKDLLADSYMNRPADRVPPKSRIPVRPQVTRFPSRRTTTTTTTTPAPAPEFQDNPSTGEKITDVIAETLLTKPEGNKLSIPVLSVATEDFEEDQPEMPTITTKKPSKVTAQTADFEEEEEEKNTRRKSPKFRTRRDSGSYWSRISSWFNFYGEETTEEEDSELGRKMSALSKRQTIADGQVTPLAEPVPVPEQVKSVDVPTQVSDAVIETILDIDDPQTRNEFAKDVPAIEDKLDELEEQAEANQTVEVSIVELGQTEAEKLGTVVEEEATIVISPEAILPEENAAEIVEEKRSLDVAPIVEISAVAEPVAEGLPIALQTEAAPLPTTEDLTKSVDDQTNDTLIDTAVVSEARLESEITPVVPEITATESEALPVDDSAPISNPTAVEDITSSSPVISEESAVPRGIFEAIPIPADTASEATPPIILILENKTVTIAIPETQTVFNVETPSRATPLADIEAEDPRIVIEPEIEEEPPLPRLLPVEPATESTPNAHVAIQEAPETTPAVRLTEIETHNVEEAVLLTETETTEVKKITEEEIIPQIITEEHAPIQVQTIEQEEQDLTINSGSDSQSISTTESTSDAETTPYFSGSSEEQDSSKEDAEKIRRKEEKRRLKEEKERLKKEEKARRKAMEKTSSEEDHHHIHLNARLEPEVEEKLTKEQMVTIFSSPEKDTEARRLEAVADIKTTDPALVISEVVEAQKNVAVVDHVVIKKDGVAEDDSVESGEDVTTILPDLMEQLDAVLEKEMTSVAEVLNVLENEIRGGIEAEGDALTTEAVTEIVTETPAAEAELTNSVVSSKNTRHLAVGYNGGGYVEKDVLPDVAERRLATEEGAAETASTDSKAFVLVGSCLFLVTGFMLFALVVLIVKRSGRHGSLDLTIEP